MMKYVHRLSSYLIFCIIMSEYLGFRMTYSTSKSARMAKKSYHLLVEVKDNIRMRSVAHGFLTNVDCTQKINK